LNKKSTTNFDNDARKNEILKGADGDVYISNVTERDVEESDQAL